MITNTGILLTNIGTPASPAPADVKKYLREFLSDPRVIKIPKLIWQPILHAFILPTRSKRSAKLYETIWTEQGSPLLTNMQKLADNLTQKINMPVKIGMHYGNPSISQALRDLYDEAVERIIILPLFPQYSSTTTGSTFDAVFSEIQKWCSIPKFSFINHYAEDENYIAALVSSIQNFWQQHGKQHLLFSFHGIPEHYIKLGDPYATHCHLTAKLVTEKLQLSPSEWDISFQSRLGPSKWLMPYTNKVLADSPSKNIYDVQVICPGFPVDCLETLEEIALRGKEQFLAAGGRSFNYIPALNDTSSHLECLTRIVLHESIIPNKEL